MDYGISGCDAGNFWTAFHAVNNVHGHWYSHTQTQMDTSLSSLLVSRPKVTRQEARKIRDMDHHNRFPHKLQNRRLCPSMKINITVQFLCTSPTVFLHTHTHMQHTHTHTHAPSVVITKHVQFKLIKLSLRGKPRHHSRVITGRDKIKIYNQTIF